MISRSMRPVPSRPGHLWGLWGLGEGGVFAALLAVGSEGWGWGGVGVVGKVPHGKQDINPEWDEKESRRGAVMYR